MPKTLENLQFELKDQDWTAELPECKYSRVSTFTNQVYAPNGSRKEGHSFNEAAFNFMKDGVCVYGLFCGHVSPRVARMAANLFPAELAFGALDSLMEPGRVQHILKDIFYSVDKQMIHSLDEILLEKATREIDQAEQVSLLSVLDTNRNYEIQQALTSSSCALISIVLNHTLYLAYVGESLAILCKANPEPGSYHVEILTAVHNLQNEDERERLSQDTKERLQIHQVNQTRFLGHFPLKSDRNPDLEVQPEFAVLPIDDSFQFLALASPGVFDAMADLNPKEDIQSLSEKLCKSILEEWSSCSAYGKDTLELSSLHTVAHNTLDRLASAHFRAYSEKRISTSRRADMTLLIRVFNPRIIHNSGQPSLSESSINSFASTLRGGLDSTLESLSGHDSTDETDVVPYVDFNLFIESASTDPEIPKEWLEIK